jgi:predicted metal-dependent hydrolase
VLEFVEYGSSKIEFEIKRSARKTLGISVLPSGKVEVTAPQDATLIQSYTAAEQIFGVWREFLSSRSALPS